MSDDTPSRATAGGLLRAAREKQGLHIAALAAAIKVAPRKLDALEHDRYDELPDATFTRALAQTVCRTLKIDARPVLALLPLAEPASLDHVTGSLNAPFRERPSRDDPGGLAVAAIRPMVWAGVALLFAALLIYVLPSGLWQGEPAVAELAAPPASAPALVAEAAPAAEAAAPAASAAEEAAASAPLIETVHSVPPQAEAASAVPPSTLLQLRAEEPSWIEVRDGRGQVLISRTVQPGEILGFDGALPIKLTIGNAPATRVSFRGQPVDLAPSTKDAVARLELQ